MPLCLLFYSSATILIVKRFEIQGSQASIMKDLGLTVREKAVVLEYCFLTFALAPQTWSFLVLTGRHVLLSIELWIDVPSLALQLPGTLGECYWVRFMASEDSSPSSGINGHRSFII